MQTGSAREIVREFIRKELAKRPGHRELGDSENLIAGGVIDSLGLIKTVNFLEERFSVKLRDEDIGPDNFESIDSITALLDRSRNS